MNWENGEYLLSDERSLLELDTICALLKDTYWAANRPRELIEKCLPHSLCFGLFHKGRQVGFSRVITDYATYGYLCDVIIHPDHRGKGLGTWLVKCILEHPALQGTRISLITRDAQGLYEKLGFGKHPFDLLVKPAPQP
jgi:ribosomal protein S18 acetylase RimI-like enzyme